MPRHNYNVNGDHNYTLIIFIYLKRENIVCVRTSSGFVVCALVGKGQRGRVAGPHVVVTSPMRDYDSTWRR